MAMVFFYHVLCILVMICHGDYYQTFSQTMKCDSARRKHTMHVLFIGSDNFILSNIVIANYLVGFESKELPATTKLGDKSHDHP